MNSKFIEIFPIGRVINDCTVIGYSKEIKNNAFVINCECNICKKHRHIRATYAVNHESVFKHGKCCYSLSEVYSIGSVINDMTVIGHHRNDYNTLYIDCVCNICGKKTSVRATSINSINTSHEWCINKPNNYNGLSVGEYVGFYSRWQNMVKRCTDPSDKSYDKYGELGITTEYGNDKKGYLGFFNDMHESYVQHCNTFGESNTTLDRIDPCGNYELSNLRWATWDEQAINKRMSKNLIFIGVDPNGNYHISNNQHKFAERYGLENSAICACLNHRLPHHHKWIFFYIYENKIPLFMFNYNNINMIDDMF